MEIPERSLNTEIQFAKGVGPKPAPLYNKLKIFTIYDLLFHLPRRYEDRRNLPRMASLRAGMSVTIKGEVTHVESKRMRNKMSAFYAWVSDGTGQVKLSWFNQPWVAKRLVEGIEVIAYGTLKANGYQLEISSPDYELIGEDDDIDEFAKIMPVYPATEGLGQKSIRRAIAANLDSYVPLIEDLLPSKIRSQNDLMDLQQAMYSVHRPQEAEWSKEARNRLVFDEFFAMQVQLQIQRAKSQKEQGISFPLNDLEKQRESMRAGLLGVTRELSPLSDEIKLMLPFALTGAQNRVVSEIWRDMERQIPMNRLVQGDVGSGKTAVSACAILGAVRCGYQAALMAPTEILAEQHYIVMKRLFEPLGYEVVFVAGKLKVKERKKVRDLLESHTAHIAVGTHALIQDDLNFHKLGLVVIDEQHRFGVMQRASLRKKAELSPDVLVMTATPIPRTLTMTLYGDLDVSVIDELPPGRKPIKTHWKKPSDRVTVYKSLLQLLEAGRQAYFVCPAIEESEKMQTQAAVDLHYRLSTGVFSNYKVGLLHGQMKSVDKEQVMEEFRNHQLDILVSTVVIEVGVDVPNATVMVIEDANRFGLSQLHQIRGRVGRGDHQSFCILISDATSEETRERLQVLVDSQDGFVISETDLRLRGPGDVMGTAQSGSLDLKLADLAQDLKILERAREAAIQMLVDDPNLTQPENKLFIKRVKALHDDQAHIIRS